jgi:chromosome partitioning protein
MITSIFNLSGGCRKTATVLSVASSLAMKGKRVLVIDINPQCDATNVLGLQRNNRDETVYDTLVSGNGLFIEETDIEGLDLVQSHEDIRNISEDCRANLKAAVDEVKNDYDYIFFDTFNDIDKVDDAALAISHLVVVPLGVDVKDINGADGTIKYLNIVRKFFGNESLKVGVLRTSVDTRFKVTMMSQQELQNRENLREVIYSTVIPSSTKVPQAFLEKKVLLQADPENPVCLAYDAFVREAFL